MQYVLTEEEYQNMLNEIKNAKKFNSDLIGDLCRMVADHKPITEWPGSIENPVPWKCIHSQKYEWYCDSCPVQSVCTKSKNWSK